MRKQDIERQWLVLRELSIDLGYAASHVAAQAAGGEETRSIARDEPE